MGLAEAGKLSPKSPKKLPSVVLELVVLKAFAEEQAATPVPAAGSTGSGSGSGGSGGGGADGCSGAR